MKKALPVGVDNFEKLISHNYYYVDKTLFIKELLDLQIEVFTMILLNFCQNVWREVVGGNASSSWTSMTFRWRTPGSAGFMMRWSALSVPCLSRH